MNNTPSLWATFLSQDQAWSPGAPFKAVCLTTVILVACGGSPNPPKLHLIAQIWSSGGPEGLFGSNTTFTFCDLRALEPWRGLGEAREERKGQNYIHKLPIHRHSAAVISKFSPTRRTTDGTLIVFQDGIHETNNTLQEMCLYACL